jgi:DNA-binding MarR family transcriptional regulator
VEAHQDPPAEPEHHEIASGLERVITLLRLIRSPLGDMNLTTSSTLSRLAAAGPKRLGDLAVDESVTQPAMTQLVSRLEGQGLAERRRQPEDQRVVMVHITEAGRQLIHEVRTNRASTVSELLITMGAEDERAIAAALPALGRLIELIAPRMQEGYPPLRGPVPDPPTG